MFSGPIEVKSWLKMGLNFKYSKYKLSSYNFSGLTFLALPRILEIGSI